MKMLVDFQILIWETSLGPSIDMNIGIGNCEFQAQTDEFFSKIAVNFTGIAVIIIRVAFSWCKRVTNSTLVFIRLTELSTLSIKLPASLWNCSVLMTLELHGTVRRVSGVSLVLRTDCRSIYSYQW